MIAAALTFFGIALAGISIAAVAAVIVQATRELWDGSLFEDER